MPSDNYTVTRIKKEDHNWLKQRAAKNHRKAPEEISAIRELLEYLHIDAIPHPADSDHVIPIVYRQTHEQA
jgi:hypothetical protein